MDTGTIYGERYEVFVSKIFHSRYSRCVIDSDRDQNFSYRKFLRQKNEILIYPITHSDCLSSPSFRSKTFHRRLHGFSQESPNPWNLGSISHTVRQIFRFPCYSLSHIFLVFHGYFMPKILNFRFSWPCTDRITDSWFWRFFSCLYNFAFHITNIIFHWCFRRIWSVYVLLHIHMNCCHVKTVMSICIFIVILYVDGLICNKIKFDTVDNFLGTNFPFTVIRKFMHTWSSG